MNRIVPNKSMFFSVDCCCQRQFGLKKQYLLDQPSSLNAILPCTPFNGVWSCVWMSNWSKSKFLHLLLDRKDLEVWSSHDQQSFPHLHPMKCQESSIFLFFLQSSHTLHLKEECSEAHYHPNIQYSTQFLAPFLYTKMLVLCVCTFLEDEMKIPELYQKLKLQTLF